jgi:hypothetical protein
MCSKEKNEDFNNDQKESFDTGLQRCKFSIVVQRSSVAYVIHPIPAVGV